MSFLYTFLVSLSGPSYSTVTMDYATADGTATAGLDYQPISGTLTLDPGFGGQYISVPVYGDTTAEPDETFTVTLSNVAGLVRLGQVTATGTIRDDDSRPAVSVSDTWLPEGNSGTTGLVFLVSLSAPSSQPVTVDYTTADGTATADSDYQAISGTLTFAPDQQVTTIVVPVYGDTAVEPDETFTVVLTNPSGATLGRAQATGFIRDDDAPRPGAPVLTVPANIVGEATSPTGATVSFTVLAVDDIDGPLTPVCVPPSGSTFAMGTTTVACSATDSDGNTATAAFTVTVVDTTPPVITAPADQTVEATSSAGAAVTFSATATDLVTFNPTIHYYEFYGTTAQAEVVSSSTFNIGDHVITAVATDAAGNVSTANFTITVADTTAPVITAPASMTVVAIDASGAPVTYTATATDLVDGLVSVSSIPASGSIFALGSTTVGLTATDSHGNTATASFLVMVVDITPPVLTLNGPNPLTLNQGTTFTDPGATAIDNVDGDLTSSIVVSGSVNTSVPGVYTLTYSISDHARNTASATRTVTVTPARTPLTVTVDSSLMLVGSTRLPTLKGTVTGLVPGDSVTVTYSTIATASSPVGMYPITANVSGPALDNYEVTVTPGTLYVVSIGADTDASGGKNVAFWDNKGNQTYLVNLNTLLSSQTGIVNDLWKTLTALNLVSQAGSAFDFSVSQTSQQDVAQLDAWLKSANAQNAAYWVSIQLAAAELNVLSKKVLAGDIVYAGNLVQYSDAYNLAGNYGLTSGGFITVENLMNAANDALWLYEKYVADPTNTPYSPYGGSDFRNYLMALAQSLQGVNNNATFVQLLPTMAELDALFASGLLS